MKFKLNLNIQSYEIDKNNESGQALLIILLIMSVILAVVLSVSTKSVSDVGVTTQQKESLRAFSAAEAGVEELLLPGSLDEIPSNTTYDADTTYSAKKNEDQAGKQYIYPRNLKSGEIATFWFVSHDSSGNLSCDSLPCSTPSSIFICWEQKALPADDTFGAVEVLVYYDINAISGTGVVSATHDSSGVRVKRLFFDSYQTRALNSHFTYVGGGCTLNSTNFTGTSGEIKFNASGLDIPNYGTVGTLLMAKAKMLYTPLDEPQPVGIETTGGAGAILPPQAITISSTGTSGSSTRKVDVAEGYPDVPSVFDTSFFGGGSIIQ